MIKNIIFDLGNVLLDFNPIKILDTVLGEQTKAKEAILAELFQEEWRQTDCGALSTQEMETIVCSRIPQWKNQLHLVCKEWFCAMPVITNMPELIIQLKKAGYNIYLLSNVSDMGRQKLMHIPAYECFDGFVLSFEECLVKPAPEIYQVLFNRFSLTPEECVFVDDRSDNIQTANQLGMNGIVFQGYDALVSQLEEILKQKI